uniref:Fetuin B n=1 Tax=Callithrix jacchus TaxID=9483 RepID=F7IIJ3_CALJA
MDLLLPLALCTLVLCCGAVSPPRPALNPLPLLSGGCNDSDVLAVAGFALRDINKDRKDGYVLSLNRVNDAQEHRQAISRRKVHMMCPDCPSPLPTDSSHPQVLEAAIKSLAKYNNGSTSKQYSLFKITKASSQWVVGPSYLVEYLIKKSPCTKSQASSCSRQSSDSVPVGICNGNWIQAGLEEFVSATCDFFESQAPATGSENSAVNQKPTSLPKMEESQQKNTPTTDSPYKAGPRGSVQYLPDLDDENSQEKGPQEAFPVHLDLATNSQGEILDVSFLFLGPVEKKLVVLPFPKEARTAECPGPAKNPSPLVLPL